MSFGRAHVLGRLSYRKQTPFNACLAFLTQNFSSSFFNHFSLLTPNKFLSHIRKNVMQCWLSAMRIGHEGHVSTWGKPWSKILHAKTKPNHFVLCRSISFQDPMFISFLPETRAPSINYNCIYAQKFFIYRHLLTTKRSFPCDGEFTRNPHISSDKNKVRKGDKSCSIAD